MSITSKKLIFLAFCWMLFFCFANIIEMARSKRRRRKKKKMKTTQTTIDFNNTKPKKVASFESLDVSGRFRIIKSISGFKILVQSLKKRTYSAPTNEQLNFLVQKKFISKDTNRQFKT